MHTTNKANYQKQLDEYLLNMNPGEKLFLHCCCAPCSSYVLEYLSSYFEITVFFYNPNLYPEDEYYLRKEELKRLISECSYRFPVHVVDCDFIHEEFTSRCSLFADAPEGGARCARCFELRLSKTAEAALKNGFDLITTTLTISPLKNAQVLNEIGKVQAEKFGIRWLPSDFKKKGGYQRSIVLSKDHHLYRQNYCGCEYSQRQAKLREIEKEPIHAKQQ